MKVTVPRSALVDHKKIISVAKRSSKMIKKSTVTITATENLSVSGMGFSENIECDVESWGRATLPFLIWEEVVRTVSLKPDKHISIRVENGLIQAGTSEASHPLIHVTGIDGSFSSLPLNASLKDIVTHVFSTNTAPEYDELIKNRTVLEVFSRLLKHIYRADENLKEWDIDTNDIAEMIRVKYQIKDRELFFKILFSDEVRALCR